MNRGAVAGVAADVRSGSKADISLSPTDVRFTPESGHGSARSRCPLCAKSGHSALRQSLLFDHLVGASEHGRWDFEP
jgi:hypothetical protein